MAEIGSQNVALASANGAEYAIWLQAGRLWHARYDTDRQDWIDLMPVGNAEGGRNLVLVGGDRVFSDGSAGLVALWEQEDESKETNSSEIYYAAAHYNGNGVLQWSEPVQYTNNNVADENIAATLTDDGVAIVTQRQNSDDGNADGDIYIRKPFLINKNDLSFITIPEVVPEYEGPSTDKQTRNVEVPSSLDGNPDGAQFRENAGWPWGTTFGFEFKLAGEGKSNRDKQTNYKRRTTEETFEPGKGRVPTKTKITGIN